MNKLEVNKFINKIRSLLQVYERNTLFRVICFAEKEEAKVPVDDDTPCMICEKCTHPDMVSMFSMVVHIGSLCGAPKEPCSLFPTFPTSYTPPVRRLGKEAKPLVTIELIFYNLFFRCCCVTVVIRVTTWRVCDHRSWPSRKVTGSVPLAST
jgi:hypothetical protein